MPICKQCNTPFPNEMIIDGKKRNLRSRQFCLECSPFMSHNTKQVLDIQLDGYKKCNQCNEVKSMLEFYTNKNKIHGGSCKVCFNKLCIERQQTNKIKMVEYGGGKCIICGYSETNGALSFHHVDPSEKDLEIGRLVTRAWENIIPELDKCVLLCVRCHNELHNSYLFDHHNSIVLDHYMKNKK
jgi:hypothetical protein